MPTEQLQRHVVTDFPALTNRHLPRIRKLMKHYNKDTVVGPGDFRRLVIQQVNVLNK